MTKRKPTTDTIRALEAVLYNHRAIELLAATACSRAIDGGPDWNWIDDEAATSAIAKARELVDGAIALARNDAACANGTPLDAELFEYARKWHRLQKDQSERNGGSWNAKKTGPNGGFPKYAAGKFKAAGQTVSEKLVRARLQAFKRNPILRIYWSMAQEPYQSSAERFAHFLPTSASSD